jgi:tetratricopeptide (TPR) repeat protein
MSSQENNAKYLQVPSFIPRPPTIGFVSRRDVERRRDLVERLKEELTTDKKQVIALWGSGGVGKTTLAAEAARELQEFFAGRIVWTSAQDRADFTFTTMLNEIATQLGQPQMRTLAPDERAKAVSIMVSAQPTLVVLDNFETIRWEEQTLCTSWLTQEASCYALITTREEIDEAHTIPVTVMSTEEAHRFLNLLIEEVKDKTVFTETVRAQIIKVAEANPYVMQWVFAQIDLADNPQDVFVDLARGEGDAATRVFDRSFNLPQLGDDGRATLLALALFVPDASRDSLAKVAGFGDKTSRVHEAIRRLGALHLISIKEGERGRRLAVTGLTRTFAIARLKKDIHAADYYQRFIEYFLNYAEAHRQTTKEDFDALEAEKDNLLKAMDISFDSGDLGSVMEMANILAAPVSGMLSVRGYWDDAIQRGEQALQAARNAQTEAIAASFAHNIAVMNQYRGDFARARQLYNESLEINKRLGSQSSIASTFHQLGRLAQSQGEFEEARRLYAQSLEIKKKLGNPSIIASTLHQLALIAQDQGDLEEARRLYEESLEINKKLSNQSGIASTLHELGRLAQNQAAFEEARRLYEESLEIKKKLGDQSGIAISLHALANLSNSQGELEEARRLYEESLAIAKKLGDKSNLALIYYNLGLLTKEEGNKIEALRLLNESLRMFEELGSPYAEMVRRDLARMEGEDS